MSSSGFTFTRVKDQMIEQLLEMGIKDFRVLDALSQVPRHLFLDQALWSRAYENRALTIGYKQTISQPYIVARMTEHLLSHTSKRGKVFNQVLEIGSGCGYQSAVLSHFANDVSAVERIKPLVGKGLQRVWGNNSSDQTIFYSSRPISNQERIVPIKRIVSNQTILL